MKLALLMAIALLASPADPRAAWIGAAQRAHAAADAAKSPLDARAQLIHFLGTPPPEGMHPGEARQIQQDAWFRVASLDLQLGHAEVAAADAAQALALGRADDLFTANLLVIRGRARELLHDDHGAVSDYQEAMRINETLLRSATEKAP